MAETFTVLSPEYSPSSIESMRTKPELVVFPAVKVSTLSSASSFPLKSYSSKSVSSSALVTPTAETVSVTPSLDLPLSVAVTVVEPPSSAMVLSLSVITRVTTGNDSSSFSASVSLNGLGRSFSPLITPADIVIDLAGACKSLLLAVIVTESLLVVAPIGMFSVVPV